MSVGHVYFGDSVTLGVRPGVSEQQTFAHKIAVSRGASYLNKGVGGNDTADGLARLNSDVIASHPEWCFVMFGINSAWRPLGPGMPNAETPELFSTNLRAIVQQLKVSGIQVVLLTPTVVREQVWVDDFPPYLQAVRRIAAEEGVILIDAYAALAQEALRLGSNFVSLYPSQQDTQHIGALGHQVVADLFSLPQNLSIGVVTPTNGGAMPFVVFHGSTGSVVRVSSDLSGVAVQRLSAGRYKLTHNTISPYSAISGAPTAPSGGMRALYPVAGTRLTGSVEIATVDQGGNGIDHEYTTVFLL